MKNGKPTNEISIQFTVDEKLSNPELVNRAQALGTELIPETLGFNGIKIKTHIYFNPHRFFIFFFKKNESIK